MLLVNLTHLSDFSYLDRLLTNAAILVWMVWRIWKTDKFASLSLKNILKFRLQTIVAVMCIGAELAFLIYDAIVTKIKYEEAFWFNESTGKAGPTPSSQYSQENKDLVFVADATLNVVFTLKNSALFLLIATFAQVARKECRCEKFMSSSEFKAYTAYSFISIAGYPILQLVFNETSRKLYATVMPQIFYSFEVLVTVALCQLTVSRLKKLRYGLPPESSTRYRLEHYCSMLHAISLFGLLDVFGLFSINVDILNEDNRVIYKSKLLTDFFTKCFNFGICGVFVPAILCLYPGQRLAVRENTTAIDGKSTMSGGSNVQGSPRATSPRRSRLTNTKRLSTASGAPSVGDVEMGSVAESPVASPRRPSVMTSNRGSISAQPNSPTSVASTVPLTAHVSP